MATSSWLNRLPASWCRDEQGRPVVTQSMVSTFVTCPREIYYGIVLGLRPKLASMPLVRGTWMHHLLEANAKGYDWRVKHQELLDKAKAEQFEEDAEALALECYNMMLSYEWVYRDDTLEPIEAELTVERPMFHGQALYRGRIDLIAKDKHGDIWLIDHKTHQNFPDWKYRELAFQHYSYLWACRKAPQYLELGIPQPKGFIYDYCKTRSISLPTLTKAGKLSRTLKPHNTTYPVLKQWLIENNLLSSLGADDLLAIPDPAEREYVTQFINEVKHQSYESFFRRDKLVFTNEQMRRQIKAFLASTKRMLSYDWSDPDTIERGNHGLIRCRYEDLSLADLIHGTSELEQRTHYTKTDNPLDYYPNQKKESNPQ